MQDVSLYDVLGVAADATPEDIRLAFLGLAHRFHPDLNSDDAHEERFKQLRHAYEILSCPDRRAIYDRTHDSYATMIRQTAPPTPYDKQGPRVRRASASTHQFRTQWLKDKKLSRERWFFVLSAVLSIGIVYWAVHFVPEMRRQFTETPRLESMPISARAAVSDPPIPTNSLPGMNNDLKQYFPETSSIVDEGAQPIINDVSRGSEAVSGSANRPVRHPEHDDLWGSKHPGAVSEWAFPVDDEFPPVASIPPTITGSFIGENPKPIAHWNSSNLSSPVTIIPRADAQPGYWSQTPRTAKLPLYIGRDPVPSQAELANSYSALTSPQYQVPSTGYVQNSYADSMLQPPINSIPSLPSHGGASYGFGGPTPPASPNYLPQRSHSLRPYPSLVNPAPQFPGRNY